MTMSNSKTPSINGTRVQGNITKQRNTATLQEPRTRGVTLTDPRTKAALAPPDYKDYSTCKIVILGKPGVGKSALVVRFMTKRFIGEYCPTLESIHKCQIYVDSEEIKMEILDTAGQDKAESSGIWKDFYAFWGDCYIYVYSINDRNSFEEVVTLKRQVDNLKSSFCGGILVGSKSDLLHDRQVTEQEGAELADDIGCKFYEVSAADWTQIDVIEDIFRDAVREFRKTRLVRDMRGRRPSSSMRFRQVIQKVITGKATNRRVTANT